MNRRQLLQIGYVATGVYLLIAVGLSAYATYSVPKEVDFRIANEEVPPKLLLEAVVVPNRDLYLPYKRHGMHVKKIGWHARLPKENLKSNTSCSINVVFSVKKSKKIAYYPKSREQAINRNGGDLDGKALCDGQSYFIFDTESMLVPRGEDNWKIIRWIDTVFGWIGWIRPFIDHAAAIEITATDKDTGAMAPMEIRECSGKSLGFNAWLDRKKSKATKKSLLLEMKWVRSFRYKFAVLVTTFLPLIFFFLIWFSTKENVEQFHGLLIFSSLISASLAIVMNVFCRDV